MNNYKKILLLVLFAGLIVFQTSCSAKVSAEKSTAIQATIVEYEGNPMIINEDNPNGIKVFDNMSIIEGDKIVTKLNERVSILIKDSTEVIIDENSEIMIDELRIENGGDSQSLSIIKGKVWSNLKEKLNVNSKYEIKTPTAVMGVRGTKFVTSYIDNSNKVVVESGIVSVKLNNSEKEHLVNASEQVEFSDSAEDEDMVVEKTNPDKLDAFDREMLNYIEETSASNSTIKESTEDTQPKPENESKVGTSLVDPNKDVKPAIKTENKDKDTLENINENTGTVVNTDDEDNVNGPLVITNPDLDAATKAVIKAEILKTELAINTANAMISNLEASESKNSLELRIDVLISQIAVEKAEYFKNQESVSAALVLVKVLPDIDLKSKLIVRLDNIQSEIDIINANSASDNSNSTGSSSSGGTSSSVNSDTSSDDDSDSENLAISNAANKVALAENATADLKTQNLINNVTTLYINAKAAVDALGASTEKTVLLSRLNVVVNSINEVQNSLDAVTSAENKVVLAENATTNLTTQSLVNNSKTLYTCATQAVVALEASGEKLSLTGRLDAVIISINNAQDIIDAISDATIKVELAENANSALITQSEINNAIDFYDTANEAVNILEDYTEKETLISRLNVVKTNIEEAQAVYNAVVFASKQVKKAEDATVNLTTQSLINTATTLYNSAEIVVAALVDYTEKDSLADRLDAVKSKIDVAIVAYAENKVVLAENAANSLSNQSLINNAKALYTTAREVVLALKASAEKLSLTGRLDIVIIKINNAQATLDYTAALSKVILAEDADNDLSSQSLITTATAIRDTAITAVNALDDSTDKVSLWDRLDDVTDNINAAQAILNSIADATEKVESAEAAIVGLTIDKITEARSFYNTAATAVELLGEGSEKTLLLSRLAVVDNIISDVEVVKSDFDAANNKVILAENATKNATENANNLSTQSLITNALTLYNAAKEAVYSLDSTINTGLVTKLNVVLDSINTLKNGLVASAVDEVALAEGATVDLSSQEFIDEATSLYADAKNLVETLDTTDTTEKGGLLTRLDEVKSDIDYAQEFLNAYLDALDKVVLAENAIADLTTQITIDNAETLYEEARTSVYDLDDSEEKDDLSSRLDAVKGDIDAAWISLATLAVEAAETNQTQNSVNSAQTLVSILDEGTEKDDLQARINAVQLIIDTLNQPTYIKEAGDLVDEAESLIKTAQKKVDNFEKNETDGNKTIAIDAIETAIAKIDEALNAIEKIQTAKTRDEKLDKLIGWSIKLVEAAMCDDDHRYDLKMDIVNECESKAREAIALYSDSNDREDYIEKLEKALKDE